MGGGVRRRVGAQAGGGPSRGRGSPLSTLGVSGTPSARTKNKVVGHYQSLPSGPTLKRTTTVGTSNDYD